MGLTENFKRGFVFSTIGLVYLIHENPGITTGSLQANLLFALISILIINLLKL